MVTRERFEIERHDVRRGEEAVGDSPCPPDGRVGKASHPQRSRSLHRLRSDVDIRVVVVSPGKAERTGFPGPVNHLNRFLHAGCPGPAVDMHAFEFTDPVAVGHTEVEAATRYDGHGGGVFGHPQRVMEGKKKHVRADADPLGPGCDGGTNREEGRRIAIFDEVVLTGPNIIKAEFLSR